MPDQAYYVRYWHRMYADVVNKLYGITEEKSIIRIVEFEYFSNGRADHVAFMNTANNRFVEFDLEQAWSTWNDLFEIMSAQKPPVSHDFVLRLKSLCPLWFLDNHEERRYGR